MERILHYIKVNSLMVALLLGIGNLYAQFACDPAFYQTLGADIKIFNINTGVYDDLGTALEPVNAAGYNRNDDLIYCLGSQPGGGTGKLYSINQNGVFTELSTLNGGVQSVAGDVDANDNLWVSGGGGQNKNLQRIQLTPPYTVDRIVFTGDDLSAENVTDIVYFENGANDFIYALSGNTQSLLVWDVTNGTVSIKSIPGGFNYGASSAATGSVPLNNTFGAGWTDLNGNLFFSNNGALRPNGTIRVQASLWQITNFEGAGVPVATWVIDTEPTSENDGAGCPLATSPVPLPTDCTEPTAISGLGNATINEGDTTSFTVTGGSPGTLAWEVTPTTGVSPITGTGNSTGNITFASSGSYTITYTATNDSDPSGCNSSETSTASAMITVNTAATNCTVPSVISGLSNVTINEGDNTSFSVTGGSPGTLSWSINPTTGVSPTTGSGTSTGNITFANSGNYTITYTATNSSDPTGCSTTETSMATAMITVNASGPMDSDGDGVLDSVENMGPNGGDANNDGTPDANQPNVASVLDASGNGTYVTIELNSSSGCAVLTRVDALTEAAVGNDPDFDYPLGLIDFTATCTSPGDSADITFYWHGIASIGAYRKFGSTAPGAMDATYRTFSITKGVEVIADNAVGTSAYSITDGIVGDESNNPMEIIDPTGPATPTSDMDGDMVLDLDDLDDDNDGILDRIEQGCDISPIFAQIARWDPNPAGAANDGNNGNTGAAKTNRYEPSFVNTTYVDATVSNLSFGSGVNDESLDTVGNDVASHGYVWISGVDGATVADARTNNDYLEFSFTMRDDIDVVARFDNIIDVTTNIAGTYETTRGLNLSSEPRKPIYADWSYQIEISYDGFVTSQILQTSKTTTRIQDGTTFTDTNNDAGGGVNAFNEFDNYQDGAGPNNDVLLQADITYVIRIYLFASENASDNVTLDNFNISINPCESFDVDGDGTPNNFDLDSDNDGCADLEEAGGSFTVADDGVTATGTVEDGNGDLVTTNLGNTVGATLLGVPNVAGTGQALGNTQDGIDYCTDTDGDTIPNSVDLDDDNDGILDANECSIVSPIGGNLITNGDFETGDITGFTTSLSTPPGSFGTYEVATDSGGFPWGNGVTDANGVPTVADQFIFMCDASNTTSAALDLVLQTNVNIPSPGIYRLSLWTAQMTTSSVTNPPELMFNIGGVDYPFTVATLALQNAAPIQTWVELTIDVVLPAGNLVMQLINQNPSSGSGNNFALDDVSIRGTMCIEDTDNDGIVNSLDLDSDGDGCPDAVEGGDAFVIGNLSDANGIGDLDGGNTGGGFTGTGSPVTTNLTGDYGSVADPVSSNYVDAQGRVTITTATNTSPGTDATVTQVVGVSQVIGQENCTDTDMDGIPNLTDLDDDNDGILDENEIACATGNFEEFVFGTFPDATISINTVTAEATGTIVTALNASAISNPGDGDFQMTARGGATPVAAVLTYTFEEEVTLVLSSHSTTGGGDFDNQDRWEISSPGTSFTVTNPGGALELNQADGTIANESLSFFRNGAGAGANLAWRIESSPSKTFTITFNTTATGNNAGRIKLGIKCIFQDIDNDGIPDKFDLDSDGDGCPDAVEGGDAFVIGNLSDANGIGDLDGGNTGGGFTGTGSPVTTNLTGDYGSVADPVASNYVDAQGRVTIAAASNTSPGTDVTVTQTIGFSQDVTIDACLDTDGDSIADVDDLDDDNDGILDTVECFIAAADECGVDNNLVFDPNFSTGVDNQLDIGADYAPIGTNFSRYADNTPASNCTASANRSLLVDLRISNQHFWRQTVNVIPNTIYTFTFWTRTQSATEADPIRAVLFDNTNTEFFNELINSITATYVEYTYTINVGATNTVRIELQGNDISTITNNNIYIDDIAFFTTVCGLDTDRDGIVNALDLDSDGDGCPDATEGDGTFAFGDLVDANGIGALDGGNMGTDFNGTATTGVTTNLTGDYGSVLDPVASNYVDAQGRVTIATATNTSPGTDATITQAIGFSQDVSQENCTDTDEDGVPDIVDIDDDNDGILDTNECPPRAEDHYSFYTGNLFVQSATTSGVIEQDGVLIGFTITHPPKTDAFSPGIFGSENRALEGLFNDASIYDPIQTPDGTGLETMPRFQNVGTYTIMFDAPVTNLRLHLWSLGDGGFFGGFFGSGVPELDFGQPVNVISSRTLPGNGIDGTTNSLRQTGVNTIASNDDSNNIGGNGTVEIPGTYTSITFNNDTNEPWWSFIMSLTDTFECDPDRDGIINSLDLDSDGDGCADAIEGGDGFVATNLVASNVPGGNTGMDYIGTGSAVQTNLTGTYGGSLDPVADNYVNAQGQVTITSATNTSPGTDAAVDQTAGFSQDITLNACTDSENDQVGNIEDVDDDNDGILDIDENACIVDSNITPTQLGSGSGNPQIFTAVNTNTVTVENRSDNTVVNDAGIGYRLGTTTATKDRSYSVTFSNPVTAIRLSFAFINNNIDGEEEINTFRINNTGSLTIEHTDTSTGIATTFSNGSLGALVGGADATTSGTLLIYSDATFTELTFRFDFVDFNPELGTNADNTFGIILTDVCEVNIDIDNDGIINSLDLDSDGDGCPDAVEGDLDFELGDLTAATGTSLDLPNNNNNDGSIPSGYAGSTTASVITNLGTTSDTNPGATFGVPLSTLANTPNTQAIGGSQDVSDDSACCDIVPPTIAPN